MASAGRDPETQLFTDAELVLGVSRHLDAYAAGPAKAALGELEFAGHVFEMAWRLRESGLSRAKRIIAIGVEAGITPRALESEMLPALEALGWIEVKREDDGRLVAVDEHVPPPIELIALAESVLDIANPTQVERAALRLLQETTRQPLTVDAALSATSSETSEVAAKEALGHLVAVKLVRRVRSDDGREVVFNPNVWQGEAEMVKAALRTEDAGAQQNVGALIEEVAARPGLPEEHVQSTEQRWVDFAVALGLIQRSVVQTTEDRERAFLFTPHVARDPFGVAVGDPSGHVRQLVGSMIYAATFAKYRLHYPAVFVRSLLSYGEAGDASPIGTDYTMLETAGIVRVEPAYRFSKLVLLQADVAEEALLYLEDREGTERGATASLRAQRSYVHVERERARLAATAPEQDADTERLISALRDTVARRRYGG